MRKSEWYMMYATMSVPLAAMFYLQPTEGLKKVAIIAFIAGLGALVLGTVSMQWEERREKEQTGMFFGWLWAIHTTLTEIHSELEPHKKGKPNERRDSDCPNDSL